MELVKVVMAKNLERGTALAEALTVVLATAKALVKAVLAKGFERAIAKALVKETMGKDSERASVKAVVMGKVEELVLELGMEMAHGEEGPLGTDTAVVTGFGSGFGIGTGSAYGNNCGGDFYVPLPGCGCSYPSEPDPDGSIDWYRVYEARSFPGAPGGCRPDSSLDWYHICHSYGVHGAGQGGQGAPMPPDSSTNRANASKLHT